MDSEFAYLILNFTFNVKLLYYHCFRAYPYVWYNIDIPFNSAIPKAKYTYLALYKKGGGACECLGIPAPSGHFV